MGRMGRMSLLKAILLLCLSWASTAQSDGCPADGGCDLRVVQPVCGIDDITYQSVCLAACQGVAVKKPEPCKPADARQFPTTTPSAGVVADDVSSAAQTSVAVFEMNRYKDEGFYFVGLGKSDPQFKPRVLRVKGGRPRVASRRKLSSAAVRFVPSTGYLYRTNDTGPSLPASFAQGDGLLTPEAASALTLATSFDPTIVAGPSDTLSAAALANDTTLLGSENSSVSDAALGRKLLDVVGPDGRVRQTPTTSYPWSVVGLLVAGGGCSGALISPTAVITAAHCIHGGQGGQWARTVTFSAGADGRARPYGTVNWLTATIYSEWPRTGCNGVCSPDRFFYDLAVVILAEPVGSRLGHLGLAASDVFSVDATTAGYPGDKASGEMWRQTCPVSDDNANDFLTRTSVCDVVPGQSGSAVWETRSNAVRAVAVAGNAQHNTFVTITTPRFWDVIRWSGASFTPWNDAGERDAWRQIYLDRHDISCANYPLRGLSDFRMEVSYNNPAVMRYRYQCSPLRRAGVDGARATRYTTPANDWGNGNAVFMDRHNVACPANTVLTRWRLLRPSGNQIVIEYWCAPASLNGNTCENLATGWNSNGNGQVNFLDRHSVSCPNEKLLTRWRLETNNPAGQYRIAFTCCGN